MDVFEAIPTRRSIRKYTDEPVSDEDLQRILAAAMAAPTARNTQCWRFVAINDRALLEAIPAVHPYAGMAARAPLAVLVCADARVAFQPDGYWVEDASAAIQNMLLAARALNLGTVWCGVHPVPERVAGMRKLFRLPEEIRPLGLVVIGHPAQPFSREDRYDPEKIHYNGWT